MKRKDLEKRYQYLYKTFKSPDFCVYCNGAYECLDHVPALINLYRNGTDYYRNHKIDFLLFKSCKSCNVILGSTNNNTYFERLQYLEHKFKKNIKSG
jgi:hypothetical protein